MTKKRVVGLLASVSLLVGLFIVLPLLGADEKQKEGRDGLYRPLGLFPEVLSLVRSNYVEPVELKPLLAGAFAGMTEAMDAVSEYVPPEKLAAFEAHQAAKGKADYVDPGLVLARRFGYPVVVAAVPGGPAAAAGFKSDDLIERIDDKPARGLGLWEAEAMLSGKPGGRVRVLVVREGKPRHRTLDVVRASWSPEKPSVTRVSGETVIRIGDFGPGTAASVKEILASFDRTKALLVDVRGNAHGSYDEAARAAALFVPAGPLGKLEGRKIEPKAFRAEAGERAHDGRVLVLVDSGTAGAAELFAGALREAFVPRSEKSNGPKDAASEPAKEPAKESANETVKDATKDGRKVVLVGEATGGLGVTTDIVRLASGGALKLSVGKVRTVSGRALSPKGLEPDDRVLLLTHDTEGEKPAGDPILQRGVKLLAEGASAKSVS